MCRSAGGEEIAAWACVCVWCRGAREWGAVVSLLCQRLKAPPLPLRRARSRVPCAQVRVKRKITSREEVEEEDLT